MLRVAVVWSCKPEAARGISAGAFPRVCQARSGRHWAGWVGGGGESRNSQCLSHVKGPVGLTHNALARTGDGQEDGTKGIAHPLGSTKQRAGAVGR